MANGFIKGVTQPQRKRVVVKEEEFGPLNEFVNNDDRLSGFPVEFRTGLHILAFIQKPTDDPEDEPEPINSTFISAQVSKLGGDGHNTTIILAIDGRVVFRESFKTVETLGLKKRNNPYGVVFHKGKKGVRTLTIGFSVPLFFLSKLELYAKVEEDDVSKIVSNVIWGTEGSGDGEPPNGPGGGEDPFP
ncbi:MAG: hypothetical protein ACE5IY_05220 [bacterium]